MTHRETRAAEANIRSVQGLEGRRYDQLFPGPTGIGMGLHQQ